MSEACSTFFFSDYVVSSLTLHQNEDILDCTESGGKRSRLKHIEYSRFIMPKTKTNQNASEMHCNCLGKHFVLTQKIQ